MKKALRGVLARLHAATNRTFTKRTVASGGVGEPQRMQPVLAPARLTPSR